MGTASTTKFIKNSAGTLTEEAALTSSVGAADANKLPALNAAGVLDDTILNATTTQAANKTVKTGADGKLDATLMPNGIGADTAQITASEALAAGDLINIWDNAGAFNMRKADASAAGKHAMGYVTAAVAQNATGTAYFEATNSQVTGLTAGTQFLSATIPGKATNTAPTGTGKIVQRVGFATSATSLNFQAGEPIVLA